MCHQPQTPEMVQAATTLFELQRADFQREMRFPSFADAQRKRTGIEPRDAQIIFPHRMRDAKGRTGEWEQWQAKEAEDRGALARVGLRSWSAPVFPNGNASCLRDRRCNKAHAPLTTGLLTVLDALAVCDSVRIFGFDAGRSLTAAPNRPIRMHYYEPPETTVPTKKESQPHAYVQEWAAMRQLTRGCRYTKTRR